MTFFHSFAVKTWRSKHQETSSDVRQPGHAARRGPGALQLNREFQQPTHCRSRHSACPTLNATDHRPTPRFAALPTAASLSARQASSIKTDKRNGILANTVPWRRLKKYHICCWYRDSHFTAYYGTSTMPFVDTATALQVAVWVRSAL
jgi:hypothetical protein